MAHDEILDIVDENDIVIGTQARSKLYEEHKSNFRVINTFLVNSKGELWLPRRSPEKHIFPLCLDMSVGGHVETGETYDQAFRRETMEELAIDIDKVDYRLLGKLSPHKDHVSAFMQVYEITSDKVPEFNKTDFVEYYWLTPKEFLGRFIEGEKVKGDLPQLIRTFYPIN